MSEEKTFKLQGHTEHQGLPLAIENRKGSVRKGIDKDGKPWRTVMQHPYGFIKKTKGADGEEIDMYLGPIADAPNAYVVHQNKEDGKTYDEDKVMLGFASREDATKAYLAHYNSPKFLGPVKEVPVEKIRALVGSDKQVSKLAEAPKSYRQHVMDFYRARAQGGVLGTQPEVSVIPAHSTAFNSAMEGGAKVASAERADHIADRIDDVGIGLIASPYLAKAIGSRLAHRPGMLGAVGQAAERYHHGFEARPLAEVAGLAAVAPSITHAAARGIDRLTHRKEKTAFLGSIARGLAPIARGVKGLASKVAPTLAANPAAAASAAQAPKKLLSAGNILKGTAIGTAGLGLYAGKKGIDTVAGLASAPTESMAPTGYQAPRVL